MSRTAVDDRAPTAFPAYFAGARPSTRTAARPPGPVAALRWAGGRLTGLLNPHWLVVPEPAVESSIRLSRAWRNYVVHHFPA